MDNTKLLELHKRVKETADFDAIEQLINYYDSIDDYEQLTKLYKLVLEINSEDPKALNNLAVIYSDYYHDYESAKNLYFHSLEIVPNNASVHFNLATLLEFKFADYNNALFYYQKAIEIDKTYFESYMSLSWLLLLYFKDVKKAYNVIVDALNYLNRFELYAHLAYIEFTYLNQFDNAIKNCEKALELSPGNDLVYTYLGKIYSLQNQYDDAALYFEKALKSNNLNPILVYEYTKILIKQNRDFLKAIDILKQATEFFTDDAIYPSYLANLYLITGNIEEAKFYLNIALEKNIKSQEALLLIGYLKLIIDNNSEDAIMYFEKVVELNPNNLNALQVIGLYNLFNNQQIDVALSYFKRIIDIKNDFYPIYFIIAQIYSEYYGDYQKAIEYYQQINVDKLNKDDLAYLYFIMGDIYDKNLKNNQIALDYYEKSYELKPNKQIEEIINHIYVSDKTLIN